MTEETRAGPTGAGAVIADIGGDRGALVLYTPDALAGAEIEISPRDTEVRTHVAVLERRVGRRPVFAAFYASLAAGEYTVWNLEGKPAGVVTIAGGEVTVARMTAASGWLTHNVDG